jgi:predicted peroxiredoxin
MKTTHILIGACVAAAAIVLATVNGQNAPNPASPRDGVIVHISHGKDSPQTAIMGLNMAHMMVQDHDVLLYFDIKGIDLATKDASELTYAPSTPSSKDELTALREKGVTMMVCPGCLKAAGKTADDLGPGMSIADKSKFFSFTKGRIVTFDY